MNNIKVASDLVKLAKTLILGGSYGINPKRPEWENNIPRDAKFVYFHLPEYIWSLSDNELKRLYKFIDKFTEEHNALLTHLFMKNRSKGENVFEVAWWVEKDNAKKMYSELKRKLPLDNEYIDDVKFFMK